jgi:hypothetical protein
MAMIVLPGGSGHRALGYGRDRGKARSPPVAFWSLFP